MKIWVDADACPVVIKEILYKAALRTGVYMSFVANQFLKVPSSQYIETIRVPGGPDVADNEIVERLQRGDLVITADIPLAARVIEKGAHALNPRGEMYSTETIRERLSVRDFMDELRSGGIETGGPQALKQKDRQIFANRLDSFLRKHGVAD